MLEKFVEQTTFVSEEDFIKNFKVKVAIDTSYQ